MKLPVLALQRARHVARAIRVIDLRVFSFTSVLPRHRSTGALNAEPLRSPCPHGSVKPRGAEGEPFPGAPQFSRTLALRPAAPKADVEAALAEKRKPFAAVDRSQVTTFAPEIAATPELIRALTRDPELYKMTTSFEDDNEATVLGGGHVQIYRADPTPIGPEQRFRDQLRADNDAVDYNNQKNQERKVNVPRLRERIMQVVAKNGGPWTAAEIPR